MWCLFNEYNNNLNDSNESNLNTENIKIENNYSII